MTASLLAATPGSIILLGKVWALMYVLVFLCMALGLLVIARPSKRKIMKDPDD